MTPFLSRCDGDLAADVRGGVRAVGDIVLAEAADVLREARSRGTAGVVVHNRSAGAGARRAGVTRASERAFGHRPRIEAWEDAYRKKHLEFNRGRVQAWWRFAIVVHHGEPPFQPYGIRGR
jgi:hypothetical protein